MSKKINNEIGFGEKGHIEYKWACDIQEKILQFSFQITRTNNENLDSLALILHDLIKTIKFKIDDANENLLEKEISKYYLSILYKMIGQTRDIIAGKGEYMLSYMMIFVWYIYYPDLALFALKCFVQFDDNNHPYGSWKDIKYFCKYCKSKGNDNNSNLIIYALELINLQIYKDYYDMQLCKKISLASKWIPREKSSFGWLYNLLAISFFKNYMTTASSREQIKRATLKCKTEYRKIISSLNKYIDTLQIKQCNNKWSEIDFNKVTSISLMKQKNSFLNLNKSNSNCWDNDRKMCSNNFKDYININRNINGKNISMNDFTKEAVKLSSIGTQEEIQILNSQWKNNSTQNLTLKNMIPMIDLSSSMECESINAAISLAIRIAEKSVLGKRVLAFSQIPTWINLENLDFISQVNIIKNIEYNGLNSNLYVACELILDAIVENKLSINAVKNLVLIILSDMQFDYNIDNTPLYENIENKFKIAGIKVHGIPYEPPHIIFWNLKKTNGFPCLSNIPNTSMLSGYSHLLLNQFCETKKNYHKIQYQNKTFQSKLKKDSWEMLLKILENKRYYILEDKFKNFI